MLQTQPQKKTIFLHMFCVLNVQQNIYNPVFKKFHLPKKVLSSKHFFSEQQIHREKGITNKCRLKTQVNILELRFFCATIN